MLINNSFVSADRVVL